MNVGQLVTIGIEGTKPSNLLLGFIRKEKIGGVILFERNWESVKQLDYLVNKLREAGEGKLFISVDQEGGRVIRLREPFTQFPAMKEVVTRCHGDEAAPCASLIYDIGRILATELSAVGINWNFAPVLDVATNAYNPIIGDRSFSHDPQVVAELGIELMRGLLENGVMACGKHFPGHGDTDLDSHEALPVMPHTKRRLEACELIPFRQAIAAGLPSVMTAHLLFPNLDKVNPASNSKVIVQKILREELGFKGLIVSDDLLMKGITNKMSVEEAALRSIQAGHDMVLVCRDFDLQCQVIERLSEAQEKGELVNIEEKIGRINKLKEKFCNPFKPRPPLDMIGCREHRELLEKV